jgi:hypothetical protein
VGVAEILALWMAYLEHCVKPASLALSRRMSLAISIAILGPTSAAQAQVGLTSGVAQVTLVARSSPQGALSVGVTRDVSWEGSSRTMTAALRISANSGYRLAVRRSPDTAKRVWVKSIDGNFQELTGDTPVIVDRGAHTGGERAREVQFRVEGPRSDRPTPLPIFYELVMSPTP